MLTQILVSAPRFKEQAPLSLPIGGPSRFPISFIDGLSPADAQISTSKYAIVCGEHFEGSRVNMRNIVLTLELEPNYSAGETVEQLRDELYRYFTTRHEVSLEFHSTGFSPRRITGYVESFEAPLFVQDPAVQISIVCPNPYFESTEETQIAADESPGTLIEVYNGGDTAVGAVIDIFATEDSDDVSISSYSEETLETTAMYVNYPLEKYRAIVFNTNTGSKTVEQYQSTIISLLPYVSRESEWLRFEPGMNQFTHNTTDQNAVNQMSIRFRERYVGL